MASVARRKLRSWKLQKDTKGELLQLRTGVSTLTLLIKHIYDRMDRLNSTENDIRASQLCIWLKHFHYLTTSSELAGVFGISGFLEFGRHWSSTSWNLNHRQRKTGGKYFYFTCKACLRQNGSVEFDPWKRHQSFPVMCLIETFPLPDNFFYELAGLWGSRAC